MQLKKFVSLTLSSLTAISCFVASASGAMASKLISGVAVAGPGTNASSNFVSPEPCFELYPGYFLNSLSTSRFSTGVNLPAAFEGNLPNLGNLQEIGIYYGVPKKGNAIPQGNVQVVIQTNDGFSRIATPSSSFYGPLKNNYYVYTIVVYPSDFSPSFSNKVVKTVSFRYNGSNGKVVAFFPVVIGANGLLRTEDFKFKTNADGRFNNQ